MPYYKEDRLTDGPFHSDGILSWEITGLISWAGPVNAAIKWKNWPISHVIAMSIFAVFNGSAKILANQASPAHVIVL